MDIATPDHGSSSCPRQRSGRSHQRGSTRALSLAAARCTIGGTLLLLAGCHQSPYGPAYYNSPYGPSPGYAPSYGPTYGPTTIPPGGYISPGPTYAPQNLSPTPLPGNPGSPTPINPSTGVPNWRPDTSSPSRPLDDAPPFRPTNPGATNNNLVPDPLEPDFGAPPPAAAMPRAVPLVQSPGIPSTQVSAASAADDFFEEPRRIPAMPTDADPFGIDEVATVANKQEPYGYDGQKYSWLRGIVDFDDQTQTWSIIYDLTPDAADKFGGNLVFLPHPSLTGMRPGALVLVKGSVDPGRKDYRGKALYEIVQLIPLAPPAGIQ